MSRSVVKACRFMRSRPGIRKKDKQIVNGKERCRIRHAIATERFSEAATDLTKMTYYVGDYDDFRREKGYELANMRYWNPYFLVTFGELYTTEKELKLMFSK